LQSAGILSLDDAIRVACHRGKIMQSADGTGAMASVLLDSAAASQAIASFGSALSIAAINAPGETVISGESAALDRLLEVLKTQGVSQHRLPVRYAFHSEQMAPFEKRLVETVGTLASHKANGIRAISTITGEAVERVDAAHFARGIRAPVLFAKAMQATRARFTSRLGPILSCLRRLQPAWSRPEHRTGRLFLPCGAVGLTGRQWSNARPDSMKPGILPTGPPYFHRAGGLFRSPIIPGSARGIGETSILARPIRQASISVTPYSATA
jgi:hypothetical protein